MYINLSLPFSLYLSIYLFQISPFFSLSCPHFAISLISLSLSLSIYLSLSLSLSLSHTHTNFLLSGDLCKYNPLFLFLSFSFTPRYFLIPSSSLISLFLSLSISLSSATPLQFQSHTQNFGHPLTLTSSFYRMFSFSHPLSPSLTLKISFTIGYVNSITS
jgi:hypothetical protein